MPQAYINIGSNIGDRETRIRGAVALIMARIDGDARVSGPFESEPWGFVSSGMFLNVGVAVSTQMPPLELLDCLQAIEREICDAPHRNADGSYADRSIDIDLIAMEGVAMKSERLTLPHPRAALREFVMRPLVETLPQMLKTC